MTFETIDWEAEAKRVAAAFGLESWVSARSIGFIEGEDGAMYFRSERDCYPHWFEGMHFDVKYSAARRSFALAGLQDDRVEKNRQAEWTRLELDWQGRVVRAPQRLSYADSLGLALRRLGLLTPEVEVALQISAACKAEWELDERWFQKYQSLDWEAEAKRLALAFDLVGECRFESGRLSGKNSDGLSVEIVKRRGTDHYGLLGQTSPVGAWRSASLHLDERGVITYRQGKAHGLTFARALHHLGQLDEQTETAIGVVVSAHQKLEWELEYKQRIERHEAEVRKRLDRSYSTFDWPAEAERLRGAFGLETPLRFLDEPQSERGEPTPTPTRELRLANGGEIHLPDGAQLSVLYTPQRKGFTLTNPKAAKRWMSLSLNWNGTVESSFGCHQSAILTKALTELGLLTPQVEAALVGMD